MEPKKHKLLLEKQKKNDAWGKISKEIVVVEAIVRQKMTSLLGSFRQQRAKGKRSIGTGKARKEVYKSKWCSHSTKCIFCSTGINPGKP